MSERMDLLLTYLAIVNLIAFAMYGIDKRKAIKGEWRIPENALLMSAVCGGAFGAQLGMEFFHHKTKHKQFRIINAVCVGLWIFIIGACFIEGF